MGLLRLRMKRLVLSSTGLGYFPTTRCTCRTIPGFSIGLSALIVTNDRFVNLAVYYTVVRSEMVILLVLLAAGISVGN